MISKIIVKSIIDAKAPIYKDLRDNPPIWWETLKKDKDIYIEIRKRNIIDAYYLGARLAEIKREDGKLIARCNEKYIDPDSPNSDYIECHDFIESRIEDMKLNSIKAYSGEELEENISEKRIQGILRQKPIYLDSEFAFRYEKGERKTIRIDLIGINNDTLFFEELKRISDGRLLKKALSQNPEVVDQMDKYFEFIKNNENELIEYYDILWNIKKELGLPVPQRNGKKLNIDLTPLLTIINTYTKQVTKASEKKRANRIQNIQNVLNNNNIRFNIIKL